MIDLPAEAPEVLEACQEWVNDWLAASTPTTEEDVASFEDAFARQFGAPRQSLEERIREEQALAEGMMEKRRRAQGELKERNGGSR
jgi:hypothetical protein